MRLIKVLVRIHMWSIKNHILHLVVLLIKANVVWMVILAIVAFVPWVEKSAYLKSKGTISQDSYSSARMCGSENQSMGTNIFLLYLISKENGIPKFTLIGIGNVKQSSKIMLRAKTYNLHFPLSTFKVWPWNGARL